MIINDLFITDVKLGKRSFQLELHINMDLLTA